MLKVFRDNLKHLSWILWAVILVFVLLVFVDFGGAVSGFSNPTSAAVTVGDQKVTYGEFQRAHRQLDERFRQAYGDQYSPELARQLGLDRQALESLVSDKVLLHEARRLGLRVTDEELREALLPFIRSQAGNTLRQPDYERLVRGLYYSSIEEFEREVRGQLLVAKLQQILVQNIYVADAEVERAYRDQVEKAAIRYLLLPESQLAEEGRADRRELEAYLTAHADRFQVPEQRAVAYLLVDTGRLRTGIAAGEQEVAAYYRDHPEEFEQEEQVRARHILLRVDDSHSLAEATAELAGVRRRIEGGEEFATVAQEASDDPGSGARGGDLGFFGRGRMTPEFEQAAFDARQGELVGPIETPFGVHLLEVTGRREAGQQPLSEVAGRIQNKLVSEKVEQRAAEKAAALAAELRRGGGAIGAAALSAAAEAEPEVVFAETEPFGRDDLVPQIGRSPDFANAVFALSPGELTDPVRVPRGFVLATVTENLPPRAAALADVEPQVRQAVEREKRQQLAMDRLAAAKADVGSGATTLDAVAAELGLTIEESGEFGAGGAIGGLGLAPRIAEAALGMEEGEVGGPFGISRGAVLFEVTRRARWDRAGFEAARQDTRRRLEGEELNRLMGSLIQQRRAELGVRYDRQLADSLDLTGSGPGA